jgi:3D (Asp-Asp-Asp) domain-containing protein
MPDAGLVLKTAMRKKLLELMRIFLAITAITFFGACASSADPKPVATGARGKRMVVRTTAYHHSEPGGRANGIGGTLSAAHSAASDWSWMPLGTRFRIVSTGEDYVIEDYGSALVGRKTIDIYKSTRSAMNAWGVRHVEIEIIEWGSPAVSLRVLEPRQKYGYIQRMVSGLRQQVRR